MFLFIDFWPIAVIKDSKCGRGGPSHKFVAGQHYKKNHLGDYVLLIILDKLAKLYREELL